MSWVQNPRGKQNPLRHDKKVSRRQVYPTGEIAHKWAHATQESARNPQGNFYFRGDTIYSYRDSWPLARIYRHKTRGVLVLLNSSRYSVTTSGHAHRVCGALPEDWRKISVPDPMRAKRSLTDGGKAGDAANLEHLARIMADAHAKAGRRMTERAVQQDANEAAGARKAYADYLVFFGIRRKAPPLLSFAAAFERARRIEHPDPVKDAAKLRARAKRTAQSDAVNEYRAEMMRSMTAAGHGYLGYRASIGQNWGRTLARLTGQKGTPWYYFAARRTNWRLGGPFESHGHFARHFEGGGVMLRLTKFADGPDMIETSMGARVPVAAAPMVWAAVQATRAGIIGDAHHPRYDATEARIFKRLVRIGDYPLDRIDADGTLHAGCHSIPYSELRAMARALNLAGAA